MKHRRPLTILLTIVLRESVSYGESGRFLVFIHRKRSYSFNNASTGLASGLFKPSITCWWVISGVRLPSVPPLSSDSILYRINPKSRLPPSFTNYLFVLKACRLSAVYRGVWCSLFNNTCTDTNDTQYKTACMIIILMKLSICRVGRYFIIDSTISGNLGFL